MPMGGSIVSHLWLTMLPFDAFGLLLNNCFLIAAYMSSPCHIELILSEKEEPVKKEVLVSLNVPLCVG